MMRKDEARILAKNTRQTLKCDKSRIKSLIAPYLRDVKNVGIYYPLSYEIDLLFLEEEYPNINFVFPAIVGYNMVFKDHKDGFKKGPFNTFEPIGSEIPKQNIDLIITPLLAINPKSYRLGYGKGYYDRYLCDYSGKTLAIIHKELLLDFKEDKHDVKIKEVIYLWQQ